MGCDKNGCSLIFGLVLVMLTLHINHGVCVVDVKCKEMEREALLTFKSGLTDPSGRLSSWDDDHDCCQWTGVHCDHTSGHVIKLHLQNKFQFYSSPWHLGLISSSISGDIHSSLGRLNKLKHLDLFGHVRLEAENLHWVSGLHSLEFLNLGYLNLSFVGKYLVQELNMLPSLVELHLPYCSLKGTIPLTLSFINLTSLSVLDLSFNNLDSSLPCWFFNLTSLTMLVLTHNSFMGTIPQQFANLVNLEYLDFSENYHLDGQIPGETCKLKHLDLSGNKFSGEVKEFLSLCRNSSLVSLDLSINELVGELPESLRLLKNLQFLYLSANLVWGSIPKSIGNLSLLNELHLHYNHMNGSIPDSLGQLSELKVAHLVSNYWDDASFGGSDLEANSWEGVITETHLMNLTKLEYLSLGRTNQVPFLVFNVSNKWVPPFRLKNIHLNNCLVGPLFPEWLRIQTCLTEATITNAGISDMIPQEWFSSIASQLEHLDLSHNQIKGKLPHKLHLPNVIFTVDLSDNLIEGPFPLWSTNGILNLVTNSFSGPIPQDIGDQLPSLRYLEISDDGFNGSIPLSICKLMVLQALSFRSNQFSGQLPGCLGDMQSLWIIDVSNNSLSGSIPASIGFLHALNILALSDNNLEGVIPYSLKKCKHLVTIDLGGNRLSGNIPSWIGEEVLQLCILRLRSNLLQGHIPNKLCRLPNLHLLDLSKNNFSGAVPNCLSNLSALVYGNSSLDTSENANGELHIMVVSKGTNLDYSTTIMYVNSIDLSQNFLTGEIPEEITRLSSLSILNLSRNHLHGKIPDFIGNMRMLETFDLSHNNLSGTIPQSLSSLTFLSHFNLSFNNLVGRIPSGYQLQTLNNSSIYEGNPSLCGVPLQTKCPGDEKPTLVHAQDKKSKDDHEVVWFSAGIGFGFVTGFCVVCGFFLSKILWGRSYIRYLDRMTDRIALALASKFLN